MEPKVGLEPPGGPPGSPKGSQGGPWEPKGAMLVDVGIILGTFLKSKSAQNQCQKLYFSSMDFDRFGSVSGCFFVTCFDHFGGLQGWITKKRGM